MTGYEELKELVNRMERVGIDNFSVDLEQRTVFLYAEEDFRRFLGSYKDIVSIPYR